MNQDTLLKLQACCRDKAAFDELQCILQPYMVNHLHQAPLQQQEALFRVITKIRESLNLNTIFQSTATEVRQILAADRVGIFRFDPGSGCDDGEFVSESVADGYPSAIAAKVHDHCFGDSYADRYLKGQVYAIDDIYAAGLSQCHIDILSDFHVRANLVVPLLQGDRLWGLLCIHQCAAPRSWQPSEIQFMQQVATHLSVAIQQAELLKTTQQQAEQLQQALKDLRHSQTQLIQNEKMMSLGQLVAGVAHEINNPVNFIHGNLAHARQYAQDLMGLVNLYQEIYPSPPDTIRDRMDEIDLDFLEVDFLPTLRSMQIGADRIRQIVLSLRNFSRIDESDMKPVDIHEGIDSTLLILHHRLKADPARPAIAIVKHYGSLPKINCLSGELNQVFMNILSNAIDALRSQERSLPVPHLYPSPTITIETTATEAIATQPAQVSITISDNGPGILPEHQSQLFDPFFTTKPIGEGTGLGLAISYKIVTEHHHGSLRCQSVPGQYTKFEICVPVSPPVRKAGDRPSSAELFSSPF